MRDFKRAEDRSPDLDNMRAHDFSRCRDERILSLSGERGLGGRDEMKADFYGVARPRGGDDLASYLQKMKRRVSIMRSAVMRGLKEAAVGYEGEAGDLHE